MLLFLQSVIFCILKVLLIHGYLILINVNVKLLRWKGQESARVRSHSYAASVKVSVHSPSLARNSDSWWPVHGPKLDAGDGVRNPALCIISQVGSTIVELVNSFKSC